MKKCLLVSLIFCFSLLGFIHADAQNATRPQIDYMNYWNTSPNRGSRERFIYGKKFYGQDPSTAFGGIGDFV